MLDHQTKPSVATKLFHMHILAVVVQLFFPLSLMSHHLADALYLLEVDARLSSCLILSDVILLVPF